MPQLPLNTSSDRVFAQPDQGMRPIVRLAIGFVLALAGALVTFMLLT